MSSLKYFIALLLLWSVSSSGVFAEETRANADGGGNVIYLDRHHVNCGDRAILSFRLFRPTRSTIAYEYNCGNNPMGPAIEEETRANEDGGGNLIYLDRHTVDCGNKALLGFRLFRPTPSTIAYLYTCGSKALSKIERFETRATVDGSGNIIYLDRQTVSCGSRPMTRFRLFRPTGSTIAYDYSCGQ